MSEQNTDREALGDIIDDWLTDPDHIDTGFLADAILSSQWLADLIRRERGVGWAECSKARRFGLKNNPYTREQETP